MPSLWLLLLCLSCPLSVLSQASSNSSSSPSSSSPSPDKASSPVSSLPLPAASPVSSPKDPALSSTPSASLSSLTPASTPSPAPSLPLSSSSTSSLPVQSASAPASSPSPAAKATNATSGASPQLVSSVIVITVTRTGADGVVYTSLASTATALPASSGAPNTNSSGSSSSSNSTTLAIIGGIVGGLALLAGVVFIVFRCTQRRFSDLDDEDVAIKWPELVSRPDDPSTLNPLAARPTTGHGMADDDDEPDEKPRIMYSHDLAMEPSHSDQSYPGQYDSYNPYGAHPVYPTHAEPGGYYDPYLGPSSAPQPQPYKSPLVSPSAIGTGGYQHPVDMYGGGGGSDLRSEPSVSATVVSGRESWLGDRRRDETGLGTIVGGGGAVGGGVGGGEADDQNFILDHRHRQHQQQQHHHQHQMYGALGGQFGVGQSRSPFLSSEEHVGAEVGGQGQGQGQRGRKEQVEVDWDGNEVIPLTVVGSHMGGSGGGSKLGQGPPRGGPGGQS